MSGRDGARPVRPGDLAAAARVLLARPEAAWAWVARRMLAEAGRGSAHLRTHGRPHPRYGDGTVMAAALRRRPDTAVCLDDPRARRAVRAVLAVLDAAYPAAQDTQVGVVGSRSSRPSGIGSPQSMQ